MFTGLIEGSGTLAHIEKNGTLCRIRINTELAQADLQLGESIAVNGVCLTLTAWDQRSFLADVSSETLKVTTLGRLEHGAPVNLERALRLCDRLGGHLVSGHVDAIGILQARIGEGEAQRLEFSLPQEIRRYVASKGSIAIDGISLTVNEVSADSFSVMLIPHTLGRTTLKSMRIGGEVNLESDMLARYIERLTSFSAETGSKTSGLSLEFLAKNGFM
ncbi:riboflavin synthase [Geopsychrobacter electrodiphilus]|uniref:riboflavin synthase n=1 Tax=Geopsychrobacter electrodiphilus TaxID=225196 RepID=UPI00036C0DA4|nr:riboflavin synthase [Geopsychrobacter electrodiphilus]